MGNRANVYVHGARPGVYLYTQWSGEELPQTVRKALAGGKIRWDDDQYLARIIFQAMIGQDQSTTGFGITSYLGDGEDRIVDVDTFTQTVTLRQSWRDDPDPQWSFDEYINEENVDWTTGA